MDGSTGRFPTGLRFLDKQLDGGLKAGGMLALTSPTQSQVELLFQEFARERPLLYVSLLSPDEAELRRMIDPSGEDAVDLTVAYHDPDTVLADPESFAAGLPDDSYVLIDAVNPIEGSSPETYLRFLNAVKERMREGNGFAVVHCLKQEPPPENRALTLKRADHIWDLRVSVESSEISTVLLIMKSRENQTLADPLPLELTDQVRIDTSRSIA
ncbi:MAG: RAD55 family ATPase [Halobacteriales archaeon]